MPSQVKARGFGLRTLREIPMASSVIEMHGEVLSLSQGSERFAHYQAEREAAVNGGGKLPKGF